MLYVTTIMRNLINASPNEPPQDRKYFDCGANILDLLQVESLSVAFTINGECLNLLEKVLYIKCK